MPKAGGDVITIATGLRNPRYLTVDDEHVYWAEFAGMYVNGTVGKAAKSGGEVSVLAEMGDYCHPWEVAIRSGMLYWTEQCGGSPTGSVMRLDTRTGEQLTLASSQTTPNGLAVDEDYVYWGSWQGGVKRAVR